MPYKSTARAYNVNRLFIVGVVLVVFLVDLVYSNERRFISFNLINIIFVSYVMIAALVLRGHSQKIVHSFGMCARCARTCVCLRSLVVFFSFFFS